jgi:hypothetical protein
MPAPGRSMAVLVTVAMTMIMVVMIMMAVIVMTMTVVRMIVMAMIMVTMIVVTMPTLMIGPAFRMERRLDFRDPGTQPLEHIRDDMIPADANGAGRDLAFEVAIPQMIGDAGQMQRVLRPSFQQFLRCRDDLNHAAVFQNVGVTRMQHRRIREIHEELHPRDGLDDAPATAALLVIKDNGVGHGRMEVPGFRGANHDRITSGVACKQLPAGLRLRRLRTRIIRRRGWRGHGRGRRRDIHDLRRDDRRGRGHSRRDSG